MIMIWPVVMKFVNVAVRSFVNLQILIVKTKIFIPLCDSKPLEKCCWEKLLLWCDLCWSYLSTEWMGTIGMWSLIFLGTMVSFPLRIISSIWRLFQMKYNKIQQTLEIFPYQLSFISMTLKCWRGTIDPWRHSKIVLNKTNIFNFN